MSVEYDLYVRRATWLHRLDPRVKLFFLLDVTLLLFIWPVLPVVMAVIAASLLLFWHAQVPAARLVRIGRTMAPLVLLVFVLSSLSIAGDSPVWIRLGPLAVGPVSVAGAAIYALRLMALALIVFLWLSTTDHSATVRGFAALRMPYEWALILALALRYLPIFGGLFAEVREAQQARGLDLEQRGFWARLGAYRPILIAMIISALRQSEALGWALEARALGAAGVRRTVYRPLHLSRSDLYACAVLSLVLLAVLVTRLIY